MVSLRLDGTYKNSSLCDVYYPIKIRIEQIDGNERT